MTTFTKGDEITIDNTTWIVDNVVQPGAKRAGVRLVDSKNPNHFTSFFDDVLHNLIQNGKAVRKTTTHEGSNTFVVYGHFTNDSIEIYNTNTGAGFTIHTQNYDSYKSLSILLAKDQLLELAAAALDIARKL
ncbi:hypothetical protein AB0383_20395 [Amycolatopsis sp. NPDC051373]|uniref:hypothetical protein n=1 Tax=Amycolatopsis sp. NPDC051373 TaxID=3155801 RepID=UPI0034503C2F